MATGVTKPAGTVVDDASLGTLAWTNAAAASNPTDGSLDNNFATATTASAQPVTTHYLKATNFGFAIPADAKITGIRVSAYAKSGTADTSSTAFVRLYKAGVLVERNLASGLPVITNVISQFFGGEGTLWDEAWAPADVNDAGFGAAVAYTVTNDTVSVDQISITVFYLPSTANVQAAAGTALRSSAVTITGQVPWTGGQNAAGAPDGQVASGGSAWGDTQRGTLKTAGRSGPLVPADASILFVTVELYGNADDTANGRVYLAGGNTVHGAGPLMPAAGGWSAPLGGDNFGLALTPEIVNDAGFAVIIESFNTGPRVAGTVAFNVDAVRITVYYATGSGGGGTGGGAYFRKSEDTGISPGALGGVLGFPWKNAGSAAGAPDTAFASAALQTDPAVGSSGDSTFLRFSQWEGDPIPDGATVTGIEVYLWGRVDTDYDRAIQLWLSNAGGLIQTQTGSGWKFNLLPASSVEGAYFQSAVVGGPDDAWGATLTGDDVNDPEFGFWMSADLAFPVGQPARSMSVFITAAQMKIYYTGGGGGGGGGGSEAVRVAGVRRAVALGPRLIQGER